MSPSSKKGDSAHLWFVRQIHVTRLFGRIPLRTKDVVIGEIELEINRPLVALVGCR
jgi:hypothetical protein